MYKLRGHICDLYQYLTRRNHVAYKSFSLASFLDVSSTQLSPSDLTPREETMELTRSTAHKYCIVGCFFVLLCAVYQIVSLRAEGLTESYRPVLGE